VEESRWSRGLLAHIQTILSPSQAGSYTVVGERQYAPILDGSRQFDEPDVLD
jgi:hypothetical protein